MAGSGRAVGRSMPRREDARLLTGRGCFVDDVTVPGALHAAFVRSEVAAGRITRLDVKAALALDGVVAVLTAADFSVCPGALLKGTADPGAFAVWPLAVDTVRFVGDPVAVVVASSRYVAEDGCELVELDIEPDAPVIGLHAALAGARLVHPELGTNIAARIPSTEGDAVDEAIASAHLVVTRTFSNARASVVPMEGRGIVASWSGGEARMRIWASTQSPHELKAFAARLIGCRDHQVHVMMGDVGGGFGQKMYPTRDEAAVILAARVLGRTVSWIEDRRENLVAACQARAEQSTITLATDAGGRFLALKVELVDDCGAYPLGTAGSSGTMAAVCGGGPYKVAYVSISSTSVYTNTVGKGAYRGPWAIETIAREQVIDHAARALGIDPVELRLRNLITNADLPYRLSSGLTVDAVTPRETLEQAASIIDVQAFREAQAQARSEGRYLGCGFSVLLEPSSVGAGMWATEHATVRLDSDGSVVVLMSTGSHGQSLETTVPQVVADALGCAVEDVTMVQGDTDATSWGPGTGGSRSALIASGAARRAAEDVQGRIKAIAGHLLEAAVEDLEVVGGTVSVRGVPSIGSSFRDIATTAYRNGGALPSGMTRDLEASARFSPSAPFTWSNACHACVCEVDPELWTVRLLRYVVSEDCGIMINPMVVAGQIAGGVAQGIGGALLEHSIYDDAGNPLATTFLDYLIPLADDVPKVEYGHIETPSNELGGYKGMAEGSAIAAPAAVANAIADALAPFRVEPTSFPLAPSTLFALQHNPRTLEK